MSGGPLELRGALAAVQKRIVSSGPVFNEFYDPAATFEASTTIVPNTQWDGPITTELRIELGARYTLFRRDEEAVRAIAHRNALQAMSHALYADVLQDLISAIKAVGGGKRDSAMQLLSDLHRRLSGGDLS